MEDNPYATMIREIREDQKKQMPVNFRFGTVQQADPLSVEVAGTVQRAGDLQKNKDIASFEAGERVLLIPIEEEQRYIILCKVVGV